VKTKQKRLVSKEALREVFRASGYTQVPDDALEAYERELRRQVEMRSHLARLGSGRLRLSVGEARYVAGERMADMSKRLFEVPKMIQMEID
jgi:hypothetical protein